MYINITPFFAHQIAPMDLSASVAEIGRDAGADTWRAACEAAEELQLLTTPEHLDTMIEFANSAGMDLQPEDCTPAMLDQYHMLGTRSGRAVAIHYRGKALKTFTGTNNPALLGAALKWAFNQGFTHWQEGRIDPAVATWQGGDM